jgi:2-polyprenyl-6-methoxyphenol hydroxylase-like FAD-dependent oxidoreductase
MPGHVESSDIIIVGGGIAGSAMATVLARNGVRVTVLEQQRTYHDRVRGEFLAEWGVAEVDRLGLRPAFEQAGGFFPDRDIPYDEIRSPEAAEAAADGFKEIFPGIRAPMMVGHPAACTALRQAAEVAGATVILGVERVRLASGRPPAVSYVLDGEERQVRGGLVIGADGRTSAMRRYAGIPLRHAPPANLISGLLVDGVAAWPQNTQSVGTEGDVMFFIFPRGGQQLRLYLCIACEQRDRFAGPHGAARFLAAFGSLTCLPYGQAFARGVPIGPCATYSGEDTWTDTPFADGVVLIGDAAGYNNPIIGQGLSIALRDVRVLSDLLLNQPDWSTEHLQPYAEERAERLRRLRFTAALQAELSCTFGSAGAERRRRFGARQASGEEPDLGLAFRAIGRGPDQVPDSAFTDEARRHVLA